MADQEPIELNPVEIVEITNVALRLSEELRQVDAAVEQLTLVYRNAGYRGEFDRGEASSRMMDSRAYTALDARRSFLRQALYELG